MKIYKKKFEKLEDISNILASISFKFDFMNKN